MNKINELVKGLCINRRKMAEGVGISVSYLVDLLKGRRKATKEGDMRTYLRNYATEILNFLEK